MDKKIKTSLHKALVYLNPRNDINSKIITKDERSSMQIIYDQLHKDGFIIVNKEDFG